jgi:hypothetical protein
MKFLQIHTFYDLYLDLFFKKHQDLISASFDSQREALFRDAFSGGHMIAPYLNALGYESEFIIANCQPLQDMWFRENGIQEREQHPLIRMFIFVKSYVELFKPDILYLTDPMTFNDSFICQLDWKPSLIIAWRSAPTDDNVSWRLLDVLLTNNHHCELMAKSRGVHYVQSYFPGFPKLVNSQLKEVSKNIDVVFSGLYSSMHSVRNQYLYDIASVAKKSNHFSCAFYLANLWNMDIPEAIQQRDFAARWGIEMFKALKQGRICFNAHVDLIDKKASGNMRMFESTGVGTFSLVDWSPLYIDSYFVSGKEIETFRSTEELIEKIIYYLDHPEQREEIARCGQKRCLTDYSMEKKAVEFDWMIKTYLNKKNTRFFSPQEQASHLRDNAMKLISNNEIDTAFKSIIKAKSLKCPVLNLDYLKAICFIKMNRAGEAVEALKEELRYFPNNTEAKNLLDECLKSMALHKPQFYKDPDFIQIYKIIQPYTMLSEHRLFSLFILCRHICLVDLPGNFVECGVAAGGSSALIAFVIKKYSHRNRQLFAFDTFDGMPEPSGEDVSSHGNIFANVLGWGTGSCAASKEFVTNFWEKNNLNDIIIPIKGNFTNTLPHNQSIINKIAFLHLDGDWYQSTKCILDNLFDLVINYGILQVDDYGYWSGCRKAIHEFENKYHYKFNMNTIDDTGVWFFKQLM